jgi:hypothetical protein
VEFDSSNKFCILSPESRLKCNVTEGIGIIGSIISEIRQLL